VEDHLILVNGTEESEAKREGRLADTVPSALIWLNCEDTRIIASVVEEGEAGFEAVQMELAECHVCFRSAATSVDL
jgi:hypothetical protein